MKNDKNNNTNAWWQPAVFMFLRLSAWIAIPIIIGAFAGRWLDKRYDSEPWLFLLSVGGAFVISMIGLVKNTTQEYKKIEKDLPVDRQGTKEKKEKN